MPLLTERRKRRSHVLEYLQKQQEDAKAAQEESGGDQPFPDFASELGLDKSGADGQQPEGEGQQ